MPVLIVVMAAAALAACASVQPLSFSRPAPELGFRYLTLLVDDGFGGGGQWRRYESGNDLSMGARDGVYRIEFSGRRYVWAEREGEHRNIVIEADVSQISDYDHNAFGLACRLEAARSGRGYFFLISGDGYASIRWSNGRSLEPIVSAAPSEHIRRGRSSNRIRAVCIDDYLALWVNGHFLAEARDERSSQGAVALAGVMNYPGRRLSLEFDDLRIWRAALDESET